VRQADHREMANPKGLAVEKMSEDQLRVEVKALVTDRDDLKVLNRSHEVGMEKATARINELQAELKTMEEDHRKALEAMKHRVQPDNKAKMIERVAQYEKRTSQAEQKASALEAQVQPLQSSNEAGRKLNQDLKGQVIKYKSMAEETEAKAKSEIADKDEEI